MTMKVKTQKMVVTILDILLSQGLNAVDDHGASVGLAHHIDRLR